MGMVQRLAWAGCCSAKEEDMIRITQLKLPVDHREEDPQTGRSPRKLRCPQGEFFLEDRPPVAGRQT